MKAKGLQKLRWYCQMCEKQCRDENGFKCHATSEVHLRNMQLYAQNPGKFKEKFSLQFENHFVKELGRRHHTNKVKANSFYQEYIQDKEHLHMNSTKWRSLTEFICDLSRKGSIIAEETEKGWYIAWVDRSADAISETEKKRQKEKMDLDDSERDRQRALAQLKLAKEMGGPSSQAPDVQATKLQREDEEGELEFKLLDEEKQQTDQTKESNSNVVNEHNKRPKAFGFDAEEEEEEEEKGKGNADAHQEQHQKKKAKSALEEIFERETERRKRLNDKRVVEKEKPVAVVVDESKCWLVKDIIVKVMSKKLEGGKYYKKKGRVFEIHEHGLIGDLEMLDSGDQLRLASDKLETVIPPVGGQVVIVRGKQKGRLGVLETLNVSDYSADISVEGKKSITLPYEDFCKVSMK